MPEWMPTDVNAFVASKRTSRNVKPGSVIRRKNVVRTIHATPADTMPIARNTCEIGTCRPRKVTCDWPTIAVFTVAMNIVNVVIFTPLPVEPGADPMNAMIIIRRIVAK